MIARLPAWHSNEFKRLIKTPKMHAADTGMTYCNGYLTC